MTKIHRNIIRKLYDEYLYIDVLDVGIGKCRDVHTYQKYLNYHNIYGVEPNTDFSKFCKIKHIYTNTADDIFTYFKKNNITHKFHTIIFCNSYNFVTNPAITMKECEEFLHDGGRIIMVYMNNDKVETVKNKFYEIRKGEKNPDLSADHVLQGRQNFIEVFNEKTLVPPHYENQISESEILDAINKTSMKLIAKGNLTHKLSEWLVPESKLFNSMFYYVVVGKPCNNDIIFIAVDTMTKTLNDYMYYLRKKRTFCNGIEIIKFANFDIGRTSDKTTCIVVQTSDDYNKLCSELKNANKKYEVLINIQNETLLEYANIYKQDNKTFIKERQKIMDLNQPASKFGFESSSVNQH
jgi:SAM-dependent methyltransferase